MFIVISKMIQALALSHINTEAAVEKGEDGTLRGRRDIILQRIEEWVRIPKESPTHDEF